MNETAGFGFQPDRRPKILFERRIFHDLTKGRFDSAAPDISAPAAGGYAGGAAEYARLERALALDHEAALAATSWGIGQILGANHAQAGFPDVAAFVRAAVSGEAGQLAALTAYLRARPELLAALRERDWERAAYLFNGPAFKANHYDTLLEAHYAVMSEPAKRPDFTIRTAQVCLAYLGFYKGPIDGVAGIETAVAVRAFGNANERGDTSLTSALCEMLVRLAGV